MKLINWADSKISKMNVWDIGFLKLLLLIVGMIIGAYISEIVLANIFIFVGAAVSLYLLIMFKFFRK